MKAKGASPEQRFLIFSVLLILCTLTIAQSIIRSSEEIIAKEKFEFHAQCDNGGWSIDWKTQSGTESLPPTRGAIEINAPLPINPSWGEAILPITTVQRNS